MSDDCVPIDELKALVSTFRNGEEMNNIPCPSGREKGRQETYATCAKQIEEVIAEYNNDC